MVRIQIIATCCVVLMAAANAQVMPQQGMMNGQFNNGFNQNMAGFGNQNPAFRNQMGMGMTGINNGFNNGLSNGFNNQFGGIGMAGGGFQRGMNGQVTVPFLGNGAVGGFNNGFNNFNNGFNNGFGTNQFAGGFSPSTFGGPFGNTGFNNGMNNRMGMGGQFGNRQQMG